MRRIVLAAGLVAPLLLPASPVVAHGTRYAVEAVRTTVVTLGYADGDPMAFATYRLFAPGATEPLRTGRADREGRIAFRPDADGVWRIEAADDEGHALRAEVRVQDGQAAAPGGGALPDWIVAASIAFNAVALALVLQRRRTVRAAA